MHRIFGSLTTLRRPLALGFAIASVATFGVFNVSDDSEAVTPPEQLAYDPESVETAKQLWLDVNATETAATCYTDVLKEAGVLQEPIRTNAELVAAHESMTEEQQQELDDCRNQSGSKRNRRPPSSGRFF